VATEFTFEDKKKIHMLHTDMYIGNGPHNLSVTTRLAMVEDNIERIGRNINKALWLAAATLVGTLAEIALKFIK